MFSDEAEIIVKSGKGGSGCVSFHSEKYKRFGGPDGGDGGKGGNVIFKVKKNLRTLNFLRSKRIFKAKGGDNGQSQNKTGKNGDDCVIYVPAGTIIKEKSTGSILFDFSENAKETEYVICKGGRGGKGNAHFVSSVNQAPRFAQEGETGQELELYIELKLIADVGLVGFPNAGKSSFLRIVSNAKPEVANYPFTTLNPHLGVVDIGDYNTFIVADIPGIIEGAHQGVGLGHKFLKHIERTQVLLFLIDIFEEDLPNKYHTLKSELENHSKELSKKPFVIALNKADLFPVEDAQTIFKDFQESITDDVPMFLISVMTGYGIDTLKKKLYEIICKIKN